MTRKRSRFKCGPSGLLAGQGPVPHGSPTLPILCGLAAAAALLAPSANGVAQQANGDNGAPPVVEALPLPSSASIDLDGRILEDVWQSATPITDFTQQEPVEGGTPSERTEIRVIFDSDHLYIGAILYDDPDGILAYQRQRDAGLNTDDRFMWILDTFLDGRTGYFFEINPAGLMGDGLRGVAGEEAAGVAASARRGTASGRRAPRGARTAGPPRFASPSVRSTSTRTSTPGGSTSSARSGAGTRRSSGADSAATKGSGDRSTRGASPA